MNKTRNSKTGRNWQHYDFNPALCIEMPATLNDCKRALLGCFVEQGRAKVTTPEQRWMVAFLVRLGGYQGGLITTMRGQFFMDVRDFYVTGLCRYYETED